MITKFGKRFLTNYLAGNSNFSQKDLAFGISSTTPNVNGDDTKLGFEVYRIAANLSSVDITQTGVDGGGNPIYSYSVVYRTTLPQSFSGVISEVGLYPGTRASINNFDSKLLSTFDDPFLWQDSNGAHPSLQANTVDASGNYTFLSKLGENMIGITADQSSTKEYKSIQAALDISGYSINDSLSIAYKKADTNLSNIVIKFYSSDNDYYSITFPAASGTGDKIGSLTLNNLFDNPTGTPDPTSITRIGVSVTATSDGSTTVYFDALRVNDEDTFDPVYGLISRSVYTTGNELIKPSGRPVDVEYKLTLGF
jgi:hypothetical protein